MEGRARTGPEADRLGVSEGLRTSSDEASRNMADLVDARGAKG